MDQKEAERSVVLWMTALGKLNHLKETETSLRREIADHILNGKIKGSKKKNVGKFVMVATAKINESPDKDELKAIWPTLTKAEKACIRFKPELIAKKYAELPNDARIKSVITAKPGMPSLELKSIMEE